MTVNLDDLTIRDARDLYDRLKKFFGSASDGADHIEIKPEQFIGRYVIVRCRDAGVHAGTLVRRDSRSCILHDARRLWFWKPNHGAWLDAVSLYGLDASSKIGAVVEERLLTEDCEITICTDVAEKSIRGMADYEPK